jgi:hypothetical protein
MSSAPEIKAIETTYNGHKFRSRTEARWAIFFENLGIPYEYEKEGYDLDGVWYLPDFWIPFWGCYIEIKGAAPTREEIGKCIALSVKSNRPVYIIYGVPTPSGHSIISIGKDGSLGEKDLTPARFCPELVLVWVDGRGGEFACSSIGHPSVAEYMADNPRHECADRWPIVRDKIEQAFAAATSARFEHGQNGSQI